MILVLAKAIVFLAGAAIGLIRASHSRSRHAGRVVVRRGGPVDAVALAMAVLGFVIPIAWASTSWLTFADYAPQPAWMIAGAIILVAALWLFDRTHRDLGRNWSAKLQILDAHQLVTSGVYGRVRHPMYLSLILYGLGQAAVVPNTIAGPACLIGALALFALRAGPEERMMRERFGAAYDAYAARTARLL